MPDTPTTPRARARARTLTEITRIARRQIAEHGAPTLSLRAVARELGVVSSAVYRYYDSRDALLTALISDSYGRLGAAVAKAVDDLADPVDAAGHRARFVAACARLRSWSREHPHEFRLLYGSPVPGYAAPVETVAQAGRVVEPIIRVVAEARTAGVLGIVDPVAGPSELIVLLEDSATTLGADLPPATTAALFSVLSELIGLVTLELNGHLVGTLDPADSYAELTCARLADRVGLLGPDPASGC